MANMHDQFHLAQVLHASTHCVLERPFSCSGCACTCANVRPQAAARTRYCANPLTTTTTFSPGPLQGSPGSQWECCGACSCHCSNGCQGASPHPADICCCSSSCPSASSRRWVPASGRQEEPPESLGLSRGWAAHACAQLEPGMCYTAQRTCICFCILSSGAG
jgi:hypothetical protein